MLALVQSVAPETSISGPVFIENHGYIEIGKYVTLRSGWHKPISLSVTTPHGRLIIEDRAFINWGVNIGVALHVTIGAGALLGDDVIVYDTDWHSQDATDRNVPTSPTHIGSGVWLGARSIVLRGVDIGDNTVVAAGSVVTHSLPDHVLAAGVPARVIRTIERSR